MPSLSQVKHKSRNFHHCFFQAGQPIDPDTICSSQCVWTPDLTRPRQSAQLSGRSTLSVGAVRLTSLCRNLSTGAELRRPSQTAPRVPSAAIRQGRGGLVPTAERWSNTARSHTTPIRLHSAQLDGWLPSRRRRRSVGSGRRTETSGCAGVRRSGDEIRKGTRPNGNAFRRAVRVALEDASFQTVLPPQIKQ